MYGSAFVRDNEGRTKIHFSSLRSRKLAHSAEARCPQSSLQLFNPRRRGKKETPLSPAKSFQSLGLLSILNYVTYETPSYNVHFALLTYQFRPIQWKSAFPSFRILAFFYFINSRRARRIFSSAFLISFWCRNFSWEILLWNVRCNKKTRAFSVCTFRSWKYALRLYQLLPVSSITFLVSSRIWFSL